MPLAPPTARDLLARADVLGLTVEQRARLAALDRAWVEESAALERALAAARAAFAGFAGDAGGRGRSGEEIQRRSIEYRELSAALREARERHAARARAIAGETRRQSLAGSPRAGGDGGAR
jgi:hypothetical protein